MKKSESLFYQADIIAWIFYFISSIMIILKLIFPNITSVDMDTTILSSIFGFLVGIGFKLRIMEFK